MNGESTGDENKGALEGTFSHVGVRDSLVGTILDGRFVIEEVLGSGGMSVIYKARQLRVNRHVAIKTLRIQTEAKPIYKERFEREINSLCSLNHPNIVTVYDCIVGPDDQPYVVMDYLRGRSLEALIKSEGPLVVGRFASIAMQICSALDHAHKKGVVHRDLKPGNIVLIDDETEFVKVVDFGLAKLSVDNRNLTQSGELWGSPPYMSPEQCMGESGDERSDIYSLGAVMYEMIVGKSPFSDAHSVFDFIQRHIHASPPPFFQTNPEVNVSIELESLIFKALEKSPLDRFQTAQELQDAIVNACGEDSGKLIYHPSRAGRSTNGAGIEIGASRNESADTKPQTQDRSDKSQQVAWFAGMLGAGQLGESMAIGQTDSAVSETITSSRVNDPLLSAPETEATGLSVGQSLTAQESAASMRKESEQLFSDTDGHRLVSKEQRVALQRSELEPGSTDHASSVVSTPVPIERAAAIVSPPVPIERPSAIVSTPVPIDQLTNVAATVPTSDSEIPSDSRPHSFSEVLPSTVVSNELMVTDKSTQAGWMSNSNLNVILFLILVIALFASLACITTCMPKKEQPSSVKSGEIEAPVREHRRPVIKRTPTEAAPAPGEPTNQTTDIEFE